MLTTFVQILLRAYKTTRRYGISFLAALIPDTGCRFTPTCSVYASKAYSRHGFIKGSILTVKRLLRCHPWGGSGHDPVPSKKPAS